MLAVAAVEWASGVLTVTVQAAPIPGDYLFESPELVVVRQAYRPTPATLQAARRAWLDMADAAGRLTLVFEGIGLHAGAGELVFNPGSEPANPVSPRVTLPVEWGPAETP